MSVIGSWGTELVFSVDSNEQLPFRDLKRKFRTRWATHPIIQDKVRAEFQGLDQVENTLTVTFSAHRGQSPRRYVERLEEAAKNGEIYYLYVGGKRVGEEKCYIESIDTDWKEIWSKGELVSATADITFKEYT